MAAGKTAGAYRMAPKKPSQRMRKGDPSMGHEPGGVRGPARTPGMQVDRVIRPRMPGERTPARPAPGAKPIKPGGERGMGPMGRNAPVSAPKKAPARRPAPARAPRPTPAGISLATPRPPVSVSKQPKSPNPRMTR